GVVVDEAQGFDLVQRAEVPGVVVRPDGLQAGQVEPAEDPDPVVDRDHDGIGLAGQRSAVVHRVGRVADHVAAAVDEDDHREVRAVGRRAVDVQRQAVFRADRLLQTVADVEVVVRAVRRRAEHPALLDATVTEVARLPDARPRAVRYRGAPAQLAYRGLGVGDAEPGVGAGGRAFVYAGDQPERGHADHR